ncbi:MAG: aminotransferase class I/II-fold pyridoxal phosphate-dependent enzyme [Verrucomicrobiota bacterium]
MRDFTDFLTVGAAAPLQAAALPGLLFNTGYYQQLADLYTEKKEIFLSGLRRIGLAHTEPQGTYFVLADINPYLKLPRFSGFDDTAFCEWMIQNVGVAAVPGSSFFMDHAGDGLMRLHFARGQDSLQEAVRRLERLASL